METIEVRYKSISGLPLGVEAFHKYLIYTDSNGNKFIAEAFPTKSDQPNPFAPLLGELELLIESPYGAIKPNISPYTAAYVNFKEYEEAGNPGEVIGMGNDLSSQWNTIKQTFLNIGNEDTPYKPFTQNSNYTVDEALQQAGYPLPTHDGLSGYWAPGSSIGSMLDFIISAAYGADTPIQFNQVLDFDKEIFNLHNDNLFNDSFYNQISNYLSDWMLSEVAHSSTLINYNLGIDFNTPIGAFYDSQSPVNDNAASIAAKTPVLLNAVNGDVNLSALVNLDSNSDGKLSGSELGSLRGWVDVNENGVADANEIKALNLLGINEILSRDYGFYTLGNSHVADADFTELTGPNDTAPIPAGEPATEIVPSSNYRTLRSRLETPGLSQAIQHNAGHSNVNPGFVGSGESFVTFAETA